MKVRIAAASLLGSMAVLATVGCGTAAVQPSGGSNQQPGGGGSQLSPQDQTFMTQNAQTDLAEIGAGKLAVARATTGPIRQTAQTIMSDHQQILSQLQGLARDLHVTLPNSPDATQQQQAQHLETSSGTDFDHTYLQDETKGHQTSIAQTQQEIKSGSDQQVVNFAKSYLPGAEQHLRMVQNLSVPSGAGTASPSSPASPASPSSPSSPSGVNAGSGGEAAASPEMPPAVVAGLAGGGVLLVLTSGGVLLVRRRQE
jgi:putative membrane protein